MCYIPAIATPLGIPKIRMLRCFHWLLLTTPLSAAPLLQNSGFETAPFPASWTSSGGVTAVAGLSGTATAARLPFNTTATLLQHTSSTAADFTLELSLQTPGTNEAQSFRMTLLAGGEDAVDLRLGTGGILQVGWQGSYYALTRIADEATFALAINRTIKLRVIGRGFGTADAAFDLVWTESYTGSSAPAFTHAVTGLKTFAASALAAPLSGLRFARNIASANSFVVDDVSVDGAAASAPAADYHLILPKPDKVVSISGVYPHLAMTNSHAECGVGAVVPWAGKLWAMTYGPHLPNGSSDKLYEIAPDLSRVIRPESVGGTPANRFIHTASNQLNLGPCFIDASRKVRVLATTGSAAVVPGRLTATAAHLTDPDRLYLFTMEDGVYDVNVNDLTYVTRYPDIQGGGDRFLFGYHGKGAYTGQGRLVVANNGRVNNQSVPTGESGVLATWDGTTVSGNGGAYLNAAPNPDEPSGNPVAAQPDYLAGWTQVSRTQHCEVTGPGGIYGSSNPATDPIWSTGFDAKSVLLRVMEDQQWSLWRLPKGSYTHDGSHGWHTEWPRIRQLDPADPQGIYLMHMHGLFFDFPKTFSAANFAGLKPIASYYKMPTDYAMWNGKIVMGKNDASQFSNALALKDQSNLWFGTMADIENWGAPSGHGAVWMNEAIAAGQSSDPFFIAGFPQRTLHLRNLGASPVSVEIEISSGTPLWSPVRSVLVPANGYLSEIVSDLSAPWVRLKSSAATSNLTAFFHLGSPYSHGTPASAHTDEFAALADIRDTRSMSDGVIRVMNDPALPLEFASSRTSSASAASPHRYHRIAGPIELIDTVDSTAESALRSSAALSQSFVSDGGLTHSTGSDAASAWVKQGSNTYRLPKLDPLYDSPFAAGWARTQRETVTERALLNLHGTFYEVPRDVSGGMRKMRALATHGKRITDFASWRGLLVMTGVLDDAPASDKLVRNADGTAALWLGEIDDLWRMGEPRGTGGPWLATSVTAGAASDPYLMYGYDQKKLTLSSTNATTITVEVDFLADNTWATYQTFNLSAGQTLEHVFPTGFHAHWVRVKSTAATTASAQFIYGPAAGRDRLLDWAREAGLPTGSGRQVLAADDSDHDGIPALLEFAFGTDPSFSSVLPIALTLGHGDFLLRNLEPSDAITSNFQFSPDLTTWTARPDLVSISPDQSAAPSGFTRMRLAFDPSLTRQYVRLKITTP
jgi:hypothetical protein